MRSLLSTLEDFREKCLCVDEGGLEAAELGLGCVVANTA
jgi:hypothetical protein